jgi:superfamily I DNA/RNA helicase
VDGLNPNQRKAVLAEGNVLVVAIPGSGKTSVLQERVVHLYSSCSTTPIVACTFTKDAATELKHRVCASVGPLSPNVLISTFHSLCLHQLTLNGMAPNLISNIDQFFILKKAMFHTGVRESPQDLLLSIDRIKSGLGEFEPQSNRLVFRRYQELLSEKGLSDFTDLILNAVTLMESGKIDPIEMSYFLIDEFQDTDPLQFRWMAAHLKLLSPPPTTMVVGDDDQSIFGFRNATGYPAMIKFVEQFTADRITLDINYRSYSEILEIADKLIINNEDRIKKKLISNKGPGGYVNFRTFPDRINEFRAIVQTFMTTQSSITVLARTNNLLYQLEACFITHGVPYCRPSSKNFWDLEHVDLFIALLVSLESREDLGFERVFFPRGMPLDLSQRLAKDGLSFYRYVDEGRFSGEQFFGTSDETRLLALQRIIHSTSRLTTYPDNIRVNSQANIAEQYIRNHSVYSKSETKLEHIEMAKGSFLSMSGTASARANRIRQSNHQKSNSTDPIVTLMTMHSSKGLEYQNVWILACEENIIPHRDNTDNIDEERCLFYVAITRAKKSLTLSMSQQDGKSIPSRFLSEAGLLIE